MRVKAHRDYCTQCSGTGKVALPQKILAPGTVDLLLRTRDCSFCHGTGKACPGGEVFYELSPRQVRRCMTCGKEVSEDDLEAEQ